MDISLLCTSSKPQDHLLERPLFVVGGIHVHDAVRELGKHGPKPTDDIGVGDFEIEQVQKCPASPPEEPAPR